jgi:hypothetical protein
MHIACWITEATETHSEYAIPIAFPREQWFRERAHCYVYTYIARLVILKTMQLRVTDTHLSRPGNILNRI